MDTNLNLIIISQGKLIVYKTVWVMSLCSEIVVIFFLERKLNKNVVQFEYHNLSGTKLDYQCIK